MGKRGPIPKASGLRLLEGNPGKRPLNRREAKAERLAELPPAPEWMPELARELWALHGPELMRRQVLTQGDLETFEGFCVGYAAWREAEHELECSGGAVLKTQRGFPKVNPWVAIARRRCQDFMRAARELGMTPASRSRIEVAEPEREPDALTAFQLGALRRRAD